MRPTRRPTPVRIAALAAAAGLALAGCSTDEPGPSIRFEQPTDGGSVQSPVTVEMAAEGVTVEPAANGVNEGAGHFHVMVDADCVPSGEVIPSDDQHLHFGDAATTAELELEPGRHTLCLQFATGDHVASGLTDEITITVIE